MLQHYQLLPTDPRFLDLRPWEAELLYWQNVMWHRLSERTRQKLPVDKIDHLIGEELFEERLAELEAADAARGLVVDLPRPKAAPGVEAVSHWRAKTES